QSGHIILSDYATTGDGILAALQVLACVVEKGKPTSEVTSVFEPYPQLLQNVRFNGGQPLEDAKVKLVIESVEQRLNGRGRLVIRKSGTEPLIRVMAEADDEMLVHEAVQEVCEAVKAHAWLKHTKTVSPGPAAGFWLLQV